MKRNLKSCFLNVQDYHKLLESFWDQMKQLAIVFNNQFNYQQKKSKKTPKKPFQTYFLVVKLNQNNQIGDNSCQNCREH
jgi:hypothetical protein